MIKRLVLAACISAITFSTAHAGITDPAPSNFVHVWTIPGVQNNVNVGTAFVCTATETNAVSIEVFNAAGVLQSNGASATLAPGESATFVTQGLPNLVSAQDLGVSSSFQGSGRVVASSTKVICAAMLMDTSGSLISELPILKKNKQKGD